MPALFSPSYSYQVASLVTKRMISLETEPVMPPPPGVESNFDDPESYAPVVIAVSSVFTSLMIIAVLVRILVRSRIHKQWGWDDCKFATEKND